MNEVYSDGRVWISIKKRLLVLLLFGLSRERSAKQLVYYINQLKGSK